MNKDQLMQTITKIIQKNPFPKGVEVMAQFEQILREQGASKEFLDIVETCRVCFWESQEIVRDEDYLTADDVRRIKKREEQRLRDKELGRC